MSFKMSNPWGGKSPPIGGGPPNRFRAEDAEISQQQNSLTSAYMNIQHGRETKK